MRITPLRDLNSKQQELLSKSLPGPDGQPLNVFATLVRYPELMKRINALGGYFFVAGALPVRERELAILRIASHTHSDYEMGQHRWLAASVGLSQDEIEAAADPQTNHSWSNADSSLLSFVDEVISSDTLSDATWTNSVLLFGQQKSVEMLVLVGFYRMLAGVLNGLGIPLDESVRKAIEQ